MATFKTPTSEEVEATRKGECLFCRSTNISHCMGHEGKGTTVYVVLECLDCKRKWRDVYVYRYAYELTDEEYDKFLGK